MLKIKDETRDKRLAKEGTELQVTEEHFKIKTKEGVMMAFVRDDYRTREMAVYLLRHLSHQIWASGVLIEEIGILLEAQTDSNLVHDLQTALGNCPWIRLGPNGEVTELGRPL